MKKRYKNPDHRRFAEQLELVGVEVTHYNGRCYWEGPAAVAHTREEEVFVIRATTVDLQEDALGKGKILYPKEYCHQKPVYEEVEDPLEE